MSNEWIWLGSQRNGLALINKNNNTNLFFSEKNGLSNNFIADVVIDSSDTGWVSTNIGINSVNPSNQLVRTFNKDMLLNDNEYISDSSLLTSSDTIFFGGVNGFHTFIPQEVYQIKQFPLTPTISNVFIANKQVPVRSNIQPKTLENQYFFCLLYTSPSPRD